MLKEILIPSAWTDIRCFGARVFHRCLPMVYSQRSRRGAAGRHADGLLRARSPLAVRALSVSLHGARLKDFRAQPNWKGLCITSRHGASMGRENEKRFGARKPASARLSVYDQPMMNSAIQSLAVLVTLITVLAGCAALPVDAEKLSANQYKLIYHKRGVDRVDRMRQELILKAQEVCRGGFRKLREYPDPEGFGTPSWELNWDIECLK
jgi:hypothetical protein